MEKGTLILFLLLCKKGKVRSIEKEEKQGIIKSKDTHHQRCSDILPVLKASKGGGAPNVQQLLSQFYSFPIPYAVAVP